MSMPASSLVNTISGAPDGGAVTVAGLSGVRAVRRLRGVVRGVLVELPGSYSRGDTIAALRGVADVSDVEEEGVVTVQIAKGACPAAGSAGVGGQQDGQSTLKLSLP
jgi:hypothetical protein